MAKKNISVCTICGEEDCDGIEYKTEDMWGSYGLHIGIKAVCKNSDGIIKSDGKLMYKVTSGHGDYRCYFHTLILCYFIHFVKLIGFQV